MPLLDHFHPPVADLLPWESLHSSWATRLADALNENWLPENFRALERTPVNTFEPRVYSGRVGWTPVGAIELVSPGNKDRPEERRAFAPKCASYLHQGLSLVVIDIVTDRRANLHNEILGLLNRADQA